MTDAVQAELLALSKKLLDTIHAQDWEAYTRLCDPSISAFEAEALGHLVEGLPFHKFYFDMQGSGRPAQSTIGSPHVRVMGDAAVVSYIRLVQRIDAQGQATSSATQETRVWHKQGGKWLHVHFHRS